MNCRVALLKLARRGVITLPAVRQGLRPQAVAPAAPATPVAVVKGRLADLGELTVIAVSQRSERGAAQRFKDLMAAYHPLGYQPLCGRQVRYLVRSARYGEVAALSFSAAAWRLQARDQWVGWSDAARRANLQQVACNSRFLILPTVQVPHLASKVLALCTRRLGQDWEQRYGERVVLVETFVDSQRYAGTSYRAANWQRVGTTCGRGRNGRKRSAVSAPKDIYAAALERNFRQVLSREPAAGEVAPARVSGEAVPRAAPDWAEEEFGAVAVGRSRGCGNAC